ncbi:RNA polymerase sigma factor SigI [Fredinandcohnia quinoae]|uniref:RNA polymerase sigma factor SigI n=1 Tax=Fredinandcohnia quinoae TaxID=2918902 RepID=A0AAW5EC45_9BACI|nr:RNA polymerase sigma factor SigI [Fredinandcohnia sp. SECRCQ15]
MKPVLSLLFKIGKRKSTLEETVISIQKGDKDLQNDLIEKYKPFIAKNVSAVCKRYITESDDEFSIGLIAFNEAVEKYNSTKGSSLLSFAELLIKRRVIDYIRKEARVRTINFDMNRDSDEENSQTKIEASLSVEEYQRSVEHELRKEEIVHYHKILQEFNLSFHELLEISPKHADARLNAILVSKAVVDDPQMLATLFEKKQLPVKQLESKVTVSRKTIERNRKYIIAMAIILAGDYVYLHDYLKGVLEG